MSTKAGTPSVKSSRNSKNLIASFGSFLEGPKELKSITTIDGAIDARKTAHKFVRRHAHQTLKKVACIEPNISWGSSVKRKRVKFPLPDQRPILLRYAADNHNLSELVNMCATVERLLGALVWAKANKLGGYVVKRCHPTTGNLKKDKRILSGDNDLVLTKKNARTARFEVTDISGVKDKNRKIDADLKSLGAEHKRFSSDDLYLVVAARNTV